MGSKCFRPVNENKQPVYVSSINNAMDQAKRVYMQKKVEKCAIVEEIVQNENRKGNLKKLFDHLNSHQKNMLPSIKQCNRRTTFEKSFPSVIISNLFCQHLVIMLSNKKARSSIISTEQQANNVVQSRRNSMTSQSTFRNMIHELQSHFFELVIKILVYTKEKEIQNCISETLIKFSATYDEKITAKKELRNVLDLYLTIVFQKNIQLIDKDSFLPFYAYSTLISKSKNQLFTADFIEKHFNFILKLFFELEDTKLSNKTLVQSEDFIMFEDSVEAIIQGFIVCSSQNKKIKEHILTEIMLQEDTEKFEPIKTVKLQRIIKQNLNSYSRQHFMFDWLGYLVRYIGRKIQNDHESFRDSLMESIQQAQLHNFSNISLKNIISSDSRINAMQTLKRWFEEEILNSQKTLEYYSSKIFEALLFNLYNPHRGNEDVIAKAKQIINYLIERKPKKLTELLIILNKQLRKNKNQYFSTDYHPVNTNLSLIRKTLVIIEEQAAQGLWKSDISFILSDLKIKDQLVWLTFQQIEQIYAPVSKTNRPSINILYLIELAGIGFQYSNLQSEKVQMEVYNFLVSLTSCMKVHDQQIEYDYIQNFTQKNRFLLKKLSQANEAILYSFLKFNFKNLLKEDSENELWTEVLIVIILINIVIEQKRSKTSSRLNKLQNFLTQVLQIIKVENFNSTSIYDVYTKNKSLFDLSQRFSAHFEKIKLKTLEQFELNNQLNPKSVSNIECSVLSSRMDVSESNPDHDFQSIYKSISKS